MQRTKKGTFNVLIPIIPTASAQQECSRDISKLLTICAASKASLVYCTRKKKSLGLSGT